MIKENDFIELEYTGKLKDDNMIFDTTDEKTARDNGIFQEGMECRPIIVCVGQGQVIRGLDKELAGKEEGKEYSIEVKPEDAYGKKDAKLIQLIPTSKFRKQNIQPMPGMQVDIDGMAGMIKTVSGGRTMVDFNHPLSGKSLSYSIKISRIVKEDKEKIGSIIRMSLGLKDAEVKIEDKKATIESKQDIPKEIQDMLKKKIMELVPGLKDIKFIKPENKKAKGHDAGKPAKEQEDLNKGGPSPETKAEGG